MIKMMKTFSRRAFLSRYVRISRRGAVVLSLLFCLSLPLVGSCDISQSALGIMPAHAAMPGQEDAALSDEHARHRYSAMLRNILLRDSARLDGLHGAEIEALLGVPSFKRTDGPLHVWQYRSGACVLDLYVDSRAPGQEVTHHELRVRDKVRLVAPQPVQVPADPAACFRSIVALAD